MHNLNRKIGIFLIPLFLLVVPLARALPMETEYQGTVVASGAYDDEFWGPLPIGFDFVFYGNTYNEFYVSSNGLVTFGSGSAQITNFNVPHQNGTENFIAPFWDDLSIDASGDIMYQTIGTEPTRKLIIQFSNMTVYHKAELLGTMQVILYEGSNNIRLQYKSIVDLESDRASGAEATVGIENSNGMIGVQLSYNTAGYIYSGRSILLSPNGPNYDFDDHALYEGFLLINTVPRPGIPTLLSPAYNSTVGDTVTFQWEAVPNADSYFVVISQNMDLSSPIHTSADLTSLSYEYILSPNQTYYWSVYPKNSAGSIAWSEIWKFLTSSTPPLVAVPQTLYLESGELRTLPLLFTGGDAGSKTPTVTSLPLEGALYQNDGGIPGAQITSVPTDVTDASFKLIYSANGATGNGAGNFNFHFTDQTGTSADGPIVINVSPPGIPNFLLASKETDRVEITFDRNMADPTGKHLEFAIQDNGVGVTSTSCALKVGDPTTIVVYVSPNLNTDNPISVAYTKGTVAAESTGVLESFGFQIAGKLAQVINFAALPDKTYGDPSYTLSATSSSGLPITFGTSNSTVVSVSGTTATVNNAGETLISASQAGDATYTAVTFTRHQQVNKATATVTLSDLSHQYTGSAFATTVTTVPSSLDVKVTYNGLLTLPSDIGSYIVLAEVVEPNYTGSATDVMTIYNLQAPVPDIAVLPDLNGECAITPADPTATDYLGGTLIGTTTTPFPITDQGTTVITWIYDDGVGNTSTQDQSVIIEDVSAPITPSPPDLTGECFVTAAVPSTTDNCAGIITGTTADPLTYSTQGAYVITWNFDDGNGNSFDVTQNVLVDDATPPVAPILTDLTGECSATATVPTTTDACTGTVSGTTSDPLTYSSLGTHVITWTFVDGNGNSINVDQNVIVTDDTPPVTPVLTDLTGECAVTAVAPTTTDNCAGTITGTTPNPLTYSVQGSYVITWTFDDGNGNSINVDQNVTVADVTPPVTPTLTDLTGECTVTAIAPTTTDNCAGTITGTATDPLTYTTEGSHVITWTFDDGNGNSIHVDQVVIVDDITPPVTPVLADLTGECTLTAVAPTTTDNCAGTISGTTTDPLTYSVQGNHVITWNFDDGHGNSINVQQNVMISDIIPPDATAPADAVTCDGTVSSIGLTDVTDNCSTPVISYILTGATTASGTLDASGEIFAPGVTTVSYIVEDGNGNSSQYVFTVTYQEVEEIVVTNTDGTLTVSNTGSYQWINCADNSLITRETSSSFTPDISGEYAVILTQGTCSATSGCYSVTVSGIGNSEFNQGYNLYPNPAHEIVTIDMVSEHTNVTISVFDLTGKLIQRKELDRLTKTDLDLSEFKTGLYMIRIHSDQMNSVTRLVKE
jgi:hypothetical protein